MQTIESYIADQLKANEKINPDEMQDIMQKQAETMGLKNVTVKVHEANQRCPECDRRTPFEELDQFDGVCEACYIENQENED